MSPSPIPAAKRLEGKVALITGGASGIGEATARLFIKHGAKVVIADVQDELGYALCDEIGSDASITFIHCDVTSESDVKHAVDTAVSKYGNLDIMFNNAGISGSFETTITAMDSSNFRRVFDVNVLGSFLGAKHAARVMIPAGKGSIIFTTSTTSITAAGVLYTYASSKHAVVGLADNLAVELGQYGIRVNCIAPFATATPLFKRAQPLIQEVNKEERSPASGTLEESVLQPDDIAEAAVFLASDESRYVSGINLAVDGAHTKINPTSKMMVKHQHT